MVILGTPEGQDREIRLDLKPANCFVNERKRICLPPPRRDQGGDDYSLTPAEEKILSKQCGLAIEAALEFLNKTKLTGEKREEETYEAITKFLTGNPNIDYHILESTRLLLLARQEPDWDFPSEWTPPPPATEPPKQKPRHPRLGGGGKGGIARNN